MLAKRKDRVEKHRKTQKGEWMAAFPVVVNGKRHMVSDKEASLSLADYLRRLLALTGCKVVCAEGDCGACSVLVSECDEKGGASFKAINSCIYFMHQLAFQSIVTIEGLKEEQARKLYKSMAKCHSAQCGYCTPGFVMSFAGSLQGQKDSSLKEALYGNLCRCTGYTAILDGLRQYKKDESKDDLIPAVSYEKALSLFKERQTVRVQKEGFEVYTPLTMEEALLELSKEDKKLTITMQGGTDLGVLVNKNRLIPKRILNLSKIADIKYVSQEGGRCLVGGGATLRQLEDWARGSFSELYDYMRLFASPQIKSVATLAGNVGNSSPIGDLLPFLLVARGQLKLVSKERGERVVLCKDFFVDYRKTLLKKDELISQISFDVPSKGDFVRFYKVSRREHLDISSVVAAFFVPKRDTTEMKMAFGGVDKVPKRLYGAESVLKKGFDRGLWDRVKESAQKEVAPISDVRGGASYRRLLVGQLLEKLYFDLEGAKL